ncbi:MAG: hypothetical protein H7Y12_12345 [Sphingobacteriaceae bacterium]|nr:hypothetical protein [Cytophagaceae bacterium]
MEVLSQLAPFTVRSQHRYLRADTLTPTGVFLRLRDRFANPVLLENKAPYGDGAAYSYLCFEPVARFEFDGSVVKTSYPDGSTRQKTVSRKAPLPDQLDRFRTCFEVPVTQFPFQTTGLFGHTSNGVTQQSEAILPESVPSQIDVAEMMYQVFRHVLVFHHQKKSLHLFEHSYSENPNAEPSDTLDTLVYWLKNQATPTYPFETTATDLTTLVVAGAGHRVAGRSPIYPARW